MGNENIEFNQKLELLFKYEDGTMKMYEGTQNNIGKQLFITLDSQVISEPFVVSTVDSETTLIDGGFTKKEAKELATILNGSLK